MMEAMHPLLRVLKCHVSRLKIQSDYGAWFGNITYYFLSLMESFRLSNDLLYFISFILFHLISFMVCHILSELCKCWYISHCFGSKFVFATFSGFSYSNVLFSSNLLVNLCSMLCFDVYLAVSLTNDKQNSTLNLLLVLD
jgi:hypothetical protein